MVACPKWYFSWPASDLLPKRLCRRTLLLKPAPFPQKQVAMRLPAVGAAGRSRQAADACKASTPRHIARDAGAWAAHQTTVDADLLSFALADVCPQQQALEAIRRQIRQSYGRKGGRIVEAQSPGRSTPNAGPGCSKVPIAGRRAGQPLLAAADPQPRPQPPDPLAAASAALAPADRPPAGPPGRPFSVSALPARRQLRHRQPPRFEKRNIANPVPGSGTPRCGVQCASA